MQLILLTSQSVFKITSRCMNALFKQYSSFKSIVVNIGLMYDICFDRVIVIMGPIPLHGPTRKHIIFILDIDLSLSKTLKLCNLSAWSMDTAYDIWIKLFKILERQKNVRSMPFQYHVGAQIYPRTV